MKTYGRSSVVAGEKRSSLSVFVETESKRRITDYFGVPETLSKAAENKPNHLVSPKPPSQQAYLDMGQPLIYECRECGMRFDRSFGTDVRLHDRFHRFSTAGVQVRYEGRDVIGRYREYVCIRVGGRRREEVMELVNKELNAVDLRGDEAVFAMVDGKAHLCSVSIIEEGGGDEGEMRVSRIWTRRDLRRRGLAGRLLGAVADARHVSPHNILFSAPTDAGRQFAEAFTGAPVRIYR